MGAQALEDAIGDAPVVRQVVGVGRALWLRPRDQIPAKRVAEDIRAELVDHGETPIERAALQPRIVLDPESDVR
jgi:hypothetical protein